MDIVAQVLTQKKYECAACIVLLDQGPLENGRSTLRIQMYQNYIRGTNQTHYIEVALGAIFIEKI